MNEYKGKGLKEAILLTLFCLLCLGRQVYAAGTMGLEGEVTSSNGVLLTWQSDNAQNVFQIEKSQRADGGFKTLAEVSGQSGSIKCYDYSVKAGKTYYYRISRIENGEAVEQSAAVKIKVVLSIPQKLRAKKITEERVELSWESVYQAAEYRIYRSTEKNGKYRKIGSSKKESFVDTTMKKGRAYYYKVRAAGKQKSADSKVSDAAAVYIRPEALTVVGSFGNDRIRLEWNKVSGADFYYVYKLNSKGRFKEVGKTKKLFYQDKKIKYGMSYYYKVAAAYKKDGKIIKSKPNQVYEVRASCIDPNKKMVALTFDDGPGRYTGEIVNCLQAYQARATFFVLGCNVDAYPWAVQAADRIGCEIGNHSYNHSNLTRLSEQGIAGQMADTDYKVQALTGKIPTLMRPPGGAVNDRVKNSVGKPIILWSIDTLDWKTRDRDKTVQAVLANVQDGDIVLMHDIHEPSKEAALILIRELSQQGYQLVTVSELAYYRGYPLYNGGVYHRMGR
ncbi:MAG: polysaccharide deacetylase family protein [Clostridium sp.]|nr:polysaccharide deacetylase family protein [Clostridium sp.]